MRRNFIAEDIVEAFVASIDITVEKVTFKRTSHAVGYTVWDYATDSTDPMVRYFIENHNGWEKTKKAALAGVDEVRSDLLEYLTIHSIDDLLDMNSRHGEASQGLTAMVDEHRRRFNETEVK